MFKDIEYKEERGEVAIRFDSRETPIRATTLEGIKFMVIYLQLMIKTYTYRRYLPTSI